MAARQRRGAMALAPAAAPESVPAAARAGLDMGRPPHGGSRGGTKHDRPDGPSVHGSRVPEAFPNSKQGTKGRYDRTAYSPKYSLSFMSHHAERISLSVVRGVNRAIRSHLATLSARLARA